MMTNLFLRHRYLDIFLRSYRRRLKIYNQSIPSNTLSTIKKEQYRNLSIMSLTKMVVNSFFELCCLKNEHIY